MLRELLGDLVVASVELAEAPRPLNKPDVARWLRLASATGIAARDTIANDESQELLASLRATLEPTNLLSELRDAFQSGFEYARREKETIFGGAEWERACVFRSGLEAIRDLLDARLVDMAETEHLMLEWGRDLFQPMTVPDGTPSHHWWWWAGAPPNERTLRVNQRMADLLPTNTRGTYPPTRVASMQFRRIVAEGFVVDDERIFFRHGQRQPLHDPIGVEAATNMIHIEEHLDPDPSRRPVDLAGEVLACARHLACEMRRLPLPRCRIVTSVTGRRGTLTFNQVQFNELWIAGDLEQYPVALLVLDTLA